MQITYLLPLKIIFSIKQLKIEMKGYFYRTKLLFNSQLLNVIY